ncbi:MAG: Gfo/Idh/MocA family oxidoreductase [Fuerstiella sp.]|nr:Gfo/Idh/MocA family oxidoreductase [Fuerstiella sp.]
MTISRRTFLQSSAVIAPTVISSSAIGHSNRASAGDRINVAIIGCGKMANAYHIPQLLDQPDVQVVAVCEVDQTRRDHAKDRVETHYSTGKTEYQGCGTYVDFRDVISRSDIDAVCIASPDHWHAIPIIEACKSGKDVYCEKPLTLTIEEAGRCVDAARSHERIVQTGSQQRSNVFGPFREAVEIIRSGRLGKIHRVTVGVGGPSVPCDLPEEEIEPNLDWDMWLGQAPLRAYNSILSPRGNHSHFPAWRNYREYSGGGHTDMGAHHYDIAQWALDMDESGPIEIIPPEDSQATTGVRYIYENGVEMVHGGPSGCTFHGENGVLWIDRRRLESDPEEIVKTPLGKDDVHLFRSPGHHRNWIDCIKSREAPVAEVEKGARTVSIIHLGNLAYWHHKTLKWNPSKWKFEDSADNHLLDRERRDPWQLPAV